VADRLPGVIRMTAWLAPTVVMVLLAGWTWRRYRSANASTKLGLSNTVRLALMMSLFVIVYIPVLATLRAVIYPPVAVDLRMLSPVHLAVVVLLFALIYLMLWLLRPARKWTGSLVLLAVFSLFGMYAVRGGMVVQEYHRTGIGYSTAAWRQSPLLRAVNDLPASTALITNDKAAVMFLSGRPAYEVIEIYQDQPDLTFPVYGSGTDPSQRVFREQGGALVLFRASLEEDFGKYGDRIGERLAALTDGLYPYYEGEDGAIYFYQQPALQGNK
jgi:hypothetical protein